MYRLMVSLGLLLGSIGLATARSEPAPEKPGSALRPVESEQHCAARGGRWRRVGLLRLETCDLPTADAGKACRDSTECESACVAPEGAKAGRPATGRCFGSTVVVGACLTLVRKGKVDAAQCTD